MGWAIQELSKGTCREDFSVCGAASVMISSFTWLRNYMTPFLIFHHHQWQKGPGILKFF